MVVSNIPLKLKNLCLISKLKLSASILSKRILKSKIGIFFLILELFPKQSEIEF